MRDSGSEAVVSEEERAQRLLLWCVDEVGPRRYSRLLEHFGSGIAAVEAGPQACARVLGQAGLARRFAARWPSEQRWAELQGELKRLEVEAMAVEPEGSAARLAELGEAPWLFVRGRHQAMAGPLAAVVGTRSVRPDGVRLTRRVTNWCQERGWGTVSGGARGVDGEVHRACLELGLTTVVVLPAGHGHPVPLSNRGLFDSVCEAGGCLVTEHPPWCQPRPELFVRRNRLISGLAVITLVVRAPRKSGALITADWSRRQGRPVYAVPGAPDDPTAAGCLEAIREGAAILASAGDLPRAPHSSDGVAGGGELCEAGRASPPELLDGSARAVLAGVARGPASLEELVEGSGHDPSEVIEAVSRLVLGGYLEQIGPGVYRARS